VKTFFIYLKRLVFGPLVASFIISFGYVWYHIPHSQKNKMALYIFLIWLGVLLLFKFFKSVYLWLVSKFERHPFWRDEFFYFFDELFFICSLYFFTFFSRHELASLLIFFIVSVLLYFRLDAYLAKHPVPDWRRAARGFFILAAFIFLIQSVFQYFAFSHYILDSNIKFYNIVLFRSVAMAAVWLAGFALASLLYISIKNFVRFSLLIVWSALFLFSLLLGAINIGVLKHSSLYLSPAIVGHAGEGGIAVFGQTAVILISFFVAISTIAMLVIRKFMGAHKKTNKRCWYYYDFAIVAISIFAVLGIVSLRSTPEAKIIKSFYDYWRGSEVSVELDSIVKSKLERFGVFHNYDNFYLNRRDKVFENELNALPEKYKEKQPNIVIIFLESYSTRLTGVYNPEMKEVTPGLNAMAEDANTTIFKNMYNPSTPTITGLIAELCSFLPPIGHQEIEIEKHLQKHHLFCLPQALHENGYQSSLYITAVQKDFANKDSIIESMGVDEVWGTKELSDRIAGEPLSWGYSDQQMFPVLFDEMKVKKIGNEEPFLLMLSTVDTHPPFNLAKDMIMYGDGENDLLNAIHTTDHAFKLFWQDFTQSEFYENTIIVAIADHAVFPAAYEKKFFPDLAGKMTYYDEIVLMTYIPETLLPNEVDTYSSAIDFAPTMLHILGINIPNSFEGWSIFDKRPEYPNLLGMHEFGLWINQEINGSSTRRIDFAPPVDIDCPLVLSERDVETPLSLCEYKNYFQWKRQMFEEGRWWFVK